MTTPDPYLLAHSAANTLRAQSGVDAYDVAVVLGSGWAEAAETLGAAHSDVPTSTLPGFMEPSIAGHSGHILSVRLAGLNVALLTGRIHLYEGYDPNQVVHAVRTAVFAGARSVVLTSACGARHDSYLIGDPVLLSDHLNLMAASPLEGPPPPAPYASRFVDLADLYSTQLRSRISLLGLGLKTGVYAGFRGPHFETPAEILMALTLGADLVGMSTVLEAIAVKHLGAQVVGLSLVTDLVGANATVSHEEVLAAAASAVPRLSSTLSAIIPVL